MVADAVKHRPPFLSGTEVKMLQYVIRYRGRTPY